MCYNQANGLSTVYLHLNQFRNLLTTQLLGDGHLLTGPCLWHSQKDDGNNTYSDGTTGTQAMY